MAKSAKTKTDGESSVNQGTSVVLGGESFELSRSTDHFAVASAGARKWEPWKRPKRSRSVSHS